MFKQKALSLLETLLALSIVVILLSIAYPSYRQLWQHWQRKQAALLLYQVSQQLWQYHEQHFSFVGFQLPPTTSLQYNIHLDSLEKNAYLLSAAPNFNDKACGILSINQNQQKTVSGSQSVVQCW